VPHPATIWTMPTDTPLTDAMRRFLDAPLVAAIATVDPDGAPRQAVAWYRLEPDGRILINSRDGRRWPANLRREPRVALAVSDSANPWSWVGLTAVVDEISDDVEQAREEICELAYRYEGAPAASLLARFRSEPRISFRLRITAAHDHLEG
jgi:PPOX class probable F420-dependent enzyme